MSGTLTLRWRIAIALVVLLADGLLVANNWQDFEPIWPALLILLALILVGGAALGKRIAAQRAGEHA